MDLLNPQKGEKILDLGCGDGELTSRLQEKGCRVIGIDSSASMVESTKNLGIEAYVIDAHDIISKMNSMPFLAMRHCAKGSSE